MKKQIFYIIFCATVGTGIISCDDQLNQLPISTTTTESSFNNANDFTQAVNGVYSALKNYPALVYWMGEMRSDNINALHDGNRDWQGINDFDVSISTTGYVNTAWRNDFNGIFNANAVLEALLTKGNLIHNEALRVRYEAEVRFLRAFLYFQLVRTFGKVPYVDKVLTVPEVSTIPRSPVAEIYEGLIIPDLEFAAANLPEAYAAGDIGRATQYAAKGMLAAVYLTRSGPTYGIEGPGLASNEYDKALALLNEVLDGPFSFIDDYGSIFSYNNENNEEVIFDIQFASGINGAAFPSLLTPVAFWTATYGSNTYGNGQGSSNFNVSRDLLASYDATDGLDTRKGFNIQLSYSNPFIKKYIDYANRGRNRTDWPINFIVLRYTEILFLKAEALLLGNLGNQAEVDEIVNKVRRRAGLQPVSGATFDTVLEEKRKEFLGEGVRWNDLVRSGRAVTIMNAWLAKDDIKTINEITANHLIYPVPADELGAKPGLYQQNLGY
ncbi:RagB/SusD family nutrient uptake outer membrane protein [Sphingobacterium pedocola]|uniref:RagB/SusD family nutrient uptake outer membrane protein n=1 Tax=Sphingobacterium pedocola TaxID=2082722 RepID=A0ABR9T4G1_9SPHI|nr:RagB/SusD family nutrient uptake outer membrane protein [Sphingobacterium pedocola]MBE8719944.1 RagB/SusD family nutrient uptake outer membrane protein [Sphingobacterium pedocola]